MERKFSKRTNPSLAGISPLTTLAKAAGCLLRNSKANHLNWSMLKPSMRFYKTGYLCETAYKKKHNTHT